MADRCCEGTCAGLLPHFTTAAGGLLNPRHETREQALPPYAMVAELGGQSATVPPAASSSCRRTPWPSYMPSSRCLKRYVASTQCAHLHGQCKRT